MATVTKQSLALTNRDAIPRVLNGAFLEGANVRQFVGVCSVTTGDQSPSTYAFGEVPSNALVSSIKMFFDGTGGTTTAIHVGIFSTTAQGGGAISNALFATSVSLASAFTATELVHEAAVAGTSGLSGMEKRLWEVAGLASDPNTTYDIKAILSVIADNGGNLGAVIQYVS